MYEFWWKLRSGLTSKTGLVLLSAGAAAGITAGVTLSVVNGSGDGTVGSPIVAYNRNSASGTYEVWAEFVGVDTEAGDLWARNVLEVSSNDSMESSVIDTTGSIGYVAGSSVDFGTDSSAMPTPKKEGYEIVSLERDSWNPTTGEWEEITIDPTVDNIMSGQYDAQRNFNSLWRGSAEGEAVIVALETTGNANAELQTLHTAGADINEAIAAVYYAWSNDGVSAEAPKTAAGTIADPTADMTNAELIAAMTEINRLWGNQTTGFYTQGSTSVLEVTTDLAEVFYDIVDTAIPGMLVTRVGTNSGGSTYEGFINNNGHQGSSDAFKDDIQGNSPSYIGYQSRDAKQSEIDAWTGESDLYGSMAIDPVIIIANEDGFGDWDYTISTKELEGIYKTGTTTLENLD